MTSLWRGLTSRIGCLLQSVQSSAVAGTAAAQLVTTASSLVSAVLLARTIGAEGRGDLAAVMTTLTVLSWVTYLGAPQAAGYFSTVGRSSVVSVMSVAAFALGSVGAFGVWVGAVPFAGGHGELVVRTLRVGGLLLPLAGVGLCGQEILYARGSMTAWNLVRSIPVTGAAVSVPVLALIGHLTVATALVVNIGALAAWCVLGTVMAVRHAAQVRRGGLRRPALYAIERWLAFSSLGLLARLDQLLMVPLSTPTELGRYAVAVTVVGSGNLLSTAIGIAAYPTARNVGEAETLASWQRSRRRVVALGLLVSVVLVSAGSFAVPLVFGGDFRGLGLVLFLLSLSQVVDDLWSVDANTLHGLGRPRVTIVPSWVAAGFTLIALLFLSSGGLTAFEAAVTSLASGIMRFVVFRALSGTAAHQIGSSQMRVQSGSEAAGVE
jgi:O-antigen/teichoic acid export membrane protein